MPLSIEQVVSLGGYDVISADPAWSYSDKGSNGAADNHYVTMSTKAICALPVSRISADNALLFLWGVWPMLPDAFEVIKAWGFTYKTMAFVWVKTRGGDKFHFGAGRYTRANTEPCLLGVRGRGIDLVKSHSVRQLIAEESYPEEALVAPVGRHSAKPDEARARIVELVGPDATCLEMFARTRYEGFDVWGNEVDSDVVF